MSDLTSQRSQADTATALVFAFGEFELDESRWELRHRGAVLDVPPKVMKTLALLVRNRDRVVSNEELLGTLWCDVTVTEASLLKSIRIARKVLGDDGDSQRYIRNTRGRGYRFVADVRVVRESADGRPWPPSELPGPVEDGFFGREGELEVLCQGLERALSGRSSFFLLSGEAGTGKSSLVERLVERALPRGIRAVTGRASEDGGAPELRPWIQVALALSEGESDRSLEPVGRFFGGSGPEQSPTWPLLRSEAARFRFFDAIASFLQERSRRTPLLIVLEDLHAADALTLALAGFLAREMVSSRIVWVGTARLDAPPVVAEALSRLTREASTLSLSGLPPRGTGELLSRRLGMQLDGRAVDRIHRITEGNPLFVVEVARKLSTAGALRAGFEQIEIPERVAEIVRARMEALGPEVQAVLGIAAVIGRDFDVPLLCRVSGEPMGDVVKRIETAMERRVVSRIAGSVGGCRFAHTLFREVLYDAMGLATRADVHARVAETLEAWSLVGEETPAAVLAHHHFRAALGGRSSKAARYARAAGDAALGTYAYEDATRHYEQALDTLDPVTERTEGCDAWNALGHARRLLGDTERAEACFRKAGSIARGIDDPIRMARAALGFAAVRPETGAVNREVIRVLDEVAIRLDGSGSGSPDGEERELESMVLARLSTCRALAGDAEAGDRLGQRALMLARASGRPLPLARALQARHWGPLWKPGRVRDRLAIAEEMVALCRAAGDAQLENEGRIAEITDLLELGRRDDLDRAVLEYARVAKASQDAGALCNARVFDTTLAMVEGRFAEAERFAEEALSLGLRISEGSARNYYAAALCWIRLQQGRAAEIEPLLRAGVEAESGSALLSSVLARIHAETGELELARAELAELTKNGLSDLRDDWAAFPVLAHLAAVSEALGDASRARIVEERLDPHALFHAVLGPAILYLGPCTFSLGLCALTRGALDEAVNLFERARDDAGKMRAAPSSAAADYHLASALLRRAQRGDTERAELLAGAALSSAGELGMRGLQTRADALLRRMDSRS